jgi:putative glycosyltransferase (TIGR04372 family)
MMPGGAIHQASVSGNDGRDVHGLLENSERHLSFTPEEEISGAQALRNLGVQEGKPFVCMLSRDFNYLKAMSPDKDWGYHDYRNVDVQTLVPAAESLTSLGYTVFKMGSESSQWINTANPMIVDYARYHRTDFLDVYLSAKCDFFLTIGTGIDAVAEIFRRPIMWVNLVPFENFHSWSANDLFITKRHWLPEKSRSMTFAEILDSGAGRSTSSKQYEDLGIELVDNSPEEIQALAMEMHQRLSGAWQTSTEDEELQQRFKFLFLTSDRHGEIRSRMGADFLRQNQELLD